MGDALRPLRRVSVSFKVGSMVNHHISETPGQNLAPGQRLSRGVARWLEGLGHAALCEFVPAPGLRVDVVSVSASGEIWIVECKSSRADFLADRKWQNYLPWCDRYYWAVDGDFPRDLLPTETGIVLADDWDGELLRDAPLNRLAAARRQRLWRDIARTAATRLQRLSDPRIGGAF